MSQLKLPPYQKRKTSSTNRPTTLNVSGPVAVQGKKSPLGYGMQSPDECPALPEGFLPLPCQVAGHAFHKGTDSLGKRKWEKALLKKHILIILIHPTQVCSKASTMVRY